MKPLKLTIQAFGPFANTEVIDFTQLGEHPLFLINGTTGSGKSTLLDAMAFALYGDTTGKDRAANDMRCQYADEALLSEVEFIFKLGANIYRIERRPEQERKKSRGEGTTTQKPEAFLYQVNDDGSEDLLVSKKIKEFNDKIIELIGLNSEQFRQVMVLPQGLFRKLLLAESKDREPILSQLFQTHIYKRLEEHIKAQAAQVTRQKQAQLEQVKGILHTVDCNKRDALHERLDLVKQALATHQQNKHHANEKLKKVEADYQAAEQLKRRFEQRDGLLQQKQSHLESQPQIDQLKQQLRSAQAAQKCLPDFQHYQQTQQGVSQLQREIIQDQTALTQAEAGQQKAEHTLAQAHNAYQARDGLNQKISQLGGLKPKLNELAEAIQQLKTVQTHVDSKNQAYQGALQQLDKRKQQRQAIQERKQTLEKMPFNEAGLVTQINQHTRRIEQHQAWLKLKQTQQQRQHELTQKQTSLEQAKRALDQQQTALNQLEYNWHLGQAAILAQTLQPNQACPVCGSHDHPRPAQWQADIEPVDKQTIEQAKTSLQNAHQAWLSVQEVVTSLHSQLNSTTEQLDSLIEQHGDLSQLSSEKLQQNFKALQTQLADGREQQALLAKLTQDLQQIENTLQSEQTALEQVHQAWHQAQTQLELAKQKVAHLEQQILPDYRDLNVLLNQISRLTQQVTQLEQAYQSAQQQKEQAQNRLIRCQQTLASRQTQLEEQRALLQKVQTHWQAVLTASEFENELGFQEALVDESRAQAWLNEIDAYQEQGAKMEGALQQLQTELETTVPPDLPAMQAQRLAEQQAYQAVEDAFNQVSIDYGKLQSALQKLEQSDVQNQALEAEFEIIGTLSLVLSGENNAKVSLQRFVLGVLLDDVLQIATIRLRNMTRGRYDLIRKDSRSKGLKASGLELEVFDSYTSQSRHVSTLSGGESFLAALALALGLSDVVQSYAGGIKLDTLFIDEGFGSLDPESLELVIDTLKNLQTTGRIIGIISHVQELKEQMPLRIDVISSVQGSHIKVVGI
ncbi:AAA family ATPase [Thiomicrospira microaerophila]|uniref:AAA family ATPase n=1 Tax=Thiomicrospira microaerophila TaxID=406020 RepID=UPI0005C9EDB4|nr:SMC family ATPase [Thiomicrospira microaerophila]